jgi:outer membrane lipoprotein SlyB
MKPTLRLLLLASLASVASLSQAEGIDTDAVIGGAVGGGLGAAAGSYFGGREGAIAGSAIGAASGTAIATQSDSDGSANDTGEVVYVTKEKSRKKAKGCPPGLRMQGRC